MVGTIRPKKSFGQHFLASQEYCRRIVLFADVDASDTVIEIGPGTGQLTEVLLATVDQLLAIELDSEMIESLKVRFPDELSRGVNRLILIHQDVLTVDWSKLLPSLPVEQVRRPNSKPTTHSRAKVVGNLPYNIATRILTSMTRIDYRFQSMTFMTQKEVAMRILAQCGQRDYGFLSLLMDYHFERIKGFDIPPGAFSPPPKVVSHVFQLRPKAPPLENDYSTWLELIGVAFRHPRKTLWNNLKSLVPDAALLSEVFAQCDVERKARPQELTFDQYLRLSRVLSLRL